eukprot:scaffold36944_cov49-Attheya_sp.AAC.6
MRDDDDCEGDRSKVLDRGATTGGSVSSQSITLELGNNGNTEELIIICYPEDVLRKKSGYFAALFESGGFVESRSRRIQLRHLDPRAVQAMFEERLWEDFNVKNPTDTDALYEAMDYLQMEFCRTNNRSVHDTIRAMHILHDPDEMIRSECIAQRWAAPETGEIMRLPTTKKKRAWRFWVCYLLAMDIFPQEERPMDQPTLTQMLIPFGDAVTLRRELIEYGLIQREGDGSAYWRPVYTIEMVLKWMHGQQRTVI